jgi:predicted PurR-regulated permease PerM
MAEEPDKSESAGPHGRAEAPEVAQQATSPLVTPLRLIALCAVVFTLDFASPVLIPLVIAMLLFYGLDPVVDAIERYRVPRLLASVAVVAAVVGGVGFGAMRLWPQVDAVVTQVPEAAKKFGYAFREESGKSLFGKVRKATAALDSAAAVAAPAADTPAEPGVLRVEVREPVRVSDWVWAGGLSVLGAAGQAVSVLFLTIFMLNEDDSFKRKLVRQMETLGGKKVTLQILNDIASQIKRFLWVQVVTSAGVAVATWLALWWLGVRQPAVWGLFAGIFNVVPYFGPLIVSTVLGGVAFLQFGTIGAAVGAGAVAMVITTVEGMFITPHLLSKAASLNTVALFVALAFWSWLWGIPGMLLAVPILMTVKAVCDHVEGLQPVGDFLGE